MPDTAPAPHRVCPGCQSAMQILLAGKVRVDRCFFCGGVYLDAGELETLAGAPLEEGTPGEPGKRVCAGCGANLAPQRIGQVTGDRCPGCGGLYLDADELQRIAGKVTLTRAEAPRTQERLQFTCPGCGETLDIEDGIATGRGLACVNCAPSIDELEGGDIFSPAGNDVGFQPEMAGTTGGTGGAGSPELEALGLLVNAASLFVG